MTASRARRKGMPPAAGAGAIAETKGGDEGDGKADKKPSVFRKPLFWIILVCVIAAIVVGGVLYLAARAPI